MSADDRQNTHAASDAEASLPVDDLNPQAVHAEAADQVRGGATTTGQVSTSDILITKHTDSTSHL